MHVILANYGFIIIDNFTILYWTFSRRKCRSGVGTGLRAGADSLGFCCGGAAYRSNSDNPNPNSAAC